MYWGIKHDVFRYTGKNLWGWKVGSTEGYGVEVDNVALPMATVVLLIVHLEICDQDVFVVTERVVECHRALIVGGARRLGGGVLHASASEHCKMGQSICTFLYICICWDIKGLKNIIWTRKISAFWHVYSSYLEQNGYKSTRHTFTRLIWSINRVLGLPHACIMRAKISVIFLSNSKYGFMSVVLFFISLLLKQILTCLSHM